MSVKTDLHLGPIGRVAADAFMDVHHERGACQPATLYLGMFWQGDLHGVMAWGYPVVNNAGVSLGVRSREILELRRMIVDDVPPKNSESRSLAIASRLISKRYPHLRVLLTYCGEEEAAVGYRASGWRCVAVSRVFSAVRVTETGEVKSAKDFRRKYGLDALSKIPHEKIVRPTQKLALGLDDEVRVRVSELADHQTPTDNGSPLETPARVV